MESEDLPPAVETAPAAPLGDHPEQCVLWKLMFLRTDPQNKHTDTEAVQEQALPAPEEHIDHRWNSSTLGPLFDRNWHYIGGGGLTQDFTRLLGFLKIFLSKIYIAKPFIFVTKIVYVI